MGFMSTPENPLDPHHAESTVVDGTPEQVYAMVADVSRMGDWSPICRSCWWDEGDGPSVGSWFTGRNEIPGRTWETRSQVVAAEPGQEFAWEVGPGFARWGYTFAPAGEDRTEVTETWTFLPTGIASFHERFGDDAENQIADRTAAAHRSIPQTLRALQAAAGPTRR